MDRSAVIRRFPAKAQAKPKLVPISEMPFAGTIKWFDPDRKFGWIEAKSGGDVFLHQSIVVKYGMRPSDLYPGLDVAFDKSSPPSGRGGPNARPEVIAIAII